MQQETTFWGESTATAGNMARWNCQVEIESYVTRNCKLTKQQF
jgi:hypothetical protein